MNGASADASRRRDLIVALMLLAATALYLSALPNHLGPPDEGHQLHEAKRVLEGDVFYRDIFEIILPGWMYLMALLFRLFGTTLTTARITAAVIHGGIVAATFLACRRLGVRGPLAAAAGVACLVVCQPAYPISSQHWLATFLAALLLVVSLELERGARRAFAAGVVVGLMIAVHHQRGVATGAGAGAFLIADALLARRYGTRQPTPLFRQVSALAAGTLFVVLPILAAIVISAGFRPAWQCLIEFPLHSYHSSPPWGFIHPSLAATVPTYPRLLEALPLTLAFGVPAAIALAVRRADLARARDLSLLVVFCLAAILSIRYNADFFHVAFIAPVFFVAIADGVERALRVLPQRFEARLGWIVGAAILGASAVKLTGYMATLRANRAAPFATAFGPVEIGAAKIALYRKLDELLTDAGERTLYVHPLPAYWYLLLDARNPTRFEFLLTRGYHADEQIQEVIASLAAAEVPYVVVDPAATPPGDPVFRFIRERYEPVRTRPIIAGWIWKRRDGKS